MGLLQFNMLPCATLLGERADLGKAEGVGACTHVLFKDNMGYILCEHHTWSKHKLRWLLNNPRDHSPMLGLLLTEMLLYGI